MKNKENLNNSPEGNEGKRKVGFSKSKFRRYLVEWAADAVVIYFI